MSSSCLALCCMLEMGSGAAAVAVAGEPAKGGVGSEGDVDHDAMKFICLSPPPRERGVCGACGRGEMKEGGGLKN